MDSLFSELRLGHSEPVLVHPLSLEGTKNWARARNGVGVGGGDGMGGDGGGGDGGGGDGGTTVSEAAGYA